MTVPERKNAASFIMFTTVRPFIFMGSSFKCFYCMEYHSELPALLHHTSAHEIKENLKVILEKYVHKGKKDAASGYIKSKMQIMQSNVQKFRYSTRTFEVRS